MFSNPHTFYMRNLILRNLEQYYEVFTEKFNAQGNEKRKCSHKRVLK